MTRLHSTLAILLLAIPLLLLPLQGHARMAAAGASMPCTMGHHGMHDAAGMMSAPSEHPCDSGGATCSVDCQHCAGCSHSPVGMALTLVLPLPGYARPAYVEQDGLSYSSIPPFKDHPPPRIG